MTLAIFTYHCPSSPSSPIPSWLKKSFKWNAELLASYNIRYILITSSGWRDQLLAIDKFSFECLSIDELIMHSSDLQVLLHGLDRVFFNDGPNPSEFEKQCYARFCAIYSLFSRPGGDLAVINRIMHLDSDILLSDIFARAIVGLRYLEKNEVRVYNTRCTPICEFSPDSLAIFVNFFLGRFFADDIMKYLLSIGDRLCDMSALHCCFPNHKLAEYAIDCLVPIYDMPYSTEDLIACNRDYALSVSGILKSLYGIDPESVKDSCDSCNYAADNFSLCGRNLLLRGRLIPFVHFQGFNKRVIPLLLSSFSLVNSPTSG
jgi:hypothetical protein